VNGAAHEDLMSDKITRNECSDLTVPLSEQDHIQGPRSAPVILIEYGDYQCPYCHNAWPMVKAIRERFGDRVAFIFRHFPQSAVHPQAGAAAKAAEAAAAQGKFWEMHDLLFTNQQELDSLDMTHLALKLGLEVYAFESSLEQDSHQRRIRDDYAGGIRSGVRGTPTFFINGCRYGGGVDLESLTDAIESRLGKSDI
jgi:protein-disulfide isomerase